AIAAYLDAAIGSGAVGDGASEAPEEPQPEPQPSAPAPGATDIAEMSEAEVEALLMQRLANR
ncbi:MAG: hypothetical protein AAF074_08785, partial [Pseudomonadota bacterium]